MVVFACGSNGSGQLGLGLLDDKDEFTVVQEIEKIDSLAGGGNHTIIIDNGKAYGAGTNEQGQLGLAVTSTTVFLEIEHPKGLKWTHCSAGWAFTILVDEYNDVWATGSGQKGEIGPFTSLNRLTKIFSGQKVLDLKSSITHTVLVTADGVYGWGASRKGQLGEALVAQKIVKEPTKLDLCPDLLQDSGIGTGQTLINVACGREFTIIGPYTLGNAPAQISPQLSRTASKIVSGWTTVGVLSAEKRVTCYGKTKDWIVPTVPLTSITAGSEHMLGTDSTTVYSWGWGEHGNCPAPFKKANARIFAGCATSFISS